MDKFLNTGKRDLTAQTFCVLQELDGNQEIRLTYALLNGSPFCSIRVWGEGDKPRKQGVTVGLEGWNYIKSFFNLDVEAKIARAAYVKCLEEGIQNNRKQECNGCVTNHPSQHQHACLTDPPQQLTEEAVGEANKELASWDVICEMAEMGKQKRIALEKPFDYFKMCRFFLIEELIREILEKNANSARPGYYV